MSFMLFTDTSKHSYSGILHQEETPHHWGAEVNLIPIAYFSGSFGRTQQLWNTTQKKCYAVYRSIQKFAFYLTGTKCTLYCDHKPLAQFFTTWMSSNMLDRWVVELQQFDITCRCDIQAWDTGSVSGQWQQRCTICSWRCCWKHHWRSPFCRHSPKEANL